MPTLTDVELSAAMSIQRNAGGYAVLLGAGVSIASGAPSAWDVQMSLVRQIASAEGADAGVKPEEWFAERFGVEPTYDGLLERLTTTPGERQALLRGFFEPATVDETAEPLRPSAAHLAIASLVAGGHVRIILTLNFDRLMEQALNAVGIEPTVIATLGDVTQMKPLHAQRCVVVHVHGEYLDPASMRNTASELGEYPQELSSLLQQVFTEYGLLISGWSGRWDKALMALLRELPSAYLPMFTIEPGAVQEAMGSVLVLRQGVHIAASADDAFTRLHEAVGAIAESVNSTPVTPAIAVARAKRALRGDGVPMTLHDDLRDIVDRVRTLPEMVAPDMRAGVTDELRRVYAVFDRELPVLIAQIATAGYWGSPETDRWVLRTVQQLADYDQVSGTTDLSEVRRWPATVAWNAALVAAVAAGRFNLVLQLLQHLPVVVDGQVRPASEVLAAGELSTAPPLHQTMRDLFVRTLGYGRAGYDDAVEHAEYLRLVLTYLDDHQSDMEFVEVLRLIVPAYSEHVPEGDFTRDRRQTPAYAALAAAVRKAPPAPVDESLHIRAGGYGANYQPRISPRLRRDLWSSGDEHPLLKELGLLDGREPVLAAMAIVDTSFEAVVKDALHRFPSSDRAYSLPSSPFWFDEYVARRERQRSRRSDR